MPRIPRKDMKTHLFHIMTQGLNKEYIFEKDMDIKYYIKNMHELKKYYRIYIIAYCIMNNHAHILLESKNISDISKYMQRLNLKYSRYYNKKYNRVGYVFRDRYKSEGIYNEKHLNNCIIYIYNNPVKAGICKDPSQYKYSNYRKVKADMNSHYSYIDIEEEKQENYRQYIKEFIKKENMNLFELKKNKEILKTLICILHNGYGLSLRKISEELNIARETLRKIYNE